MADERSLDPLHQRRPVRSFVIRGGRTTPAQQRALDGLWGRFGLVTGEPVSARRHFGREGPLFLEIGFGNGEALLKLAARHPERNYVGVEVHPPGIGCLLAGAMAQGLANVRVFRADAVEVLATSMTDDSLAGINVWFPDPWPKKRHHKRRLLRPAVVALMARRLMPDGVLHLATDWRDYAEWMMAVLSAEPALRNLAGEGAFYPAPTERPVTRFQRRGERLGHGVWDLRFARRAGAGSNGAEAGVTT